MADDINKRMNYFDRQFLRADDFRVEQAYHIDRHRRHNRMLHTPGFAEGLEVSGDPGSTTVTVSAGTAIDAKGREIVLLVSQTKPITVPDGTIEAEIYISLREPESDPSTDPGVTGNSRVTENPTFPLLPFRCPSRMCLPTACGWRR